MKKPKKAKMKKMKKIVEINAAHDFPNILHKGSL